MTRYANMTLSFLGGGEMQHGFRADKWKGVVEIYGSVSKDSVYHKISLMLIIEHHVPLLSALAPVDNQSPGL